MGNSLSGHENDGKFIGVDAIGARLVEKRHELGWSLEIAAAKSGVSVSTIGRMEQGQLKNPSAISLAMLAQAYGADLNELFAVTVEERPEVERMHEAEVELARVEGQLQVYKRNNSRLLVVCALLLPVVIGYLIWDITLRSAGLFQSTGISMLAVPIAVVVAAALVSVVASVVHRLRRKKGEE